MNLFRRRKLFINDFVNRWPQIFNKRQMNKDHIGMKYTGESYIIVISSKLNKLV